MYGLIPCLLTSRKVMFFLFICNILGSIYGFYWYKDQLLATPWYFWPLVPDSPLSSSLFTWLLGEWLWKQKVNPWIAALAFVCCLQYGVWCVFVLGIYGVRDGGMDPENWMLIVSHGAMALEVVLYASLFAFSRVHLAAAAGWIFLNDLMDYTADLHPYLEDNGLLDTVMIFTFAWSVCTIWIADYLQKNRGRLFI